MREVENEKARRTLFMMVLLGCRLGQHAWSCRCEYECECFSVNMANVNSFHSYFPATYGQSSLLPKLLALFDSSTTSTDTPHTNLHTFTPILALQQRFFATDPSHITIFHTDHTHTLQHAGRAVSRKQRSFSARSLRIHSNITPPTASFPYPHEDNNALHA